MQRECAKKQCVSWLGDEIDFLKSFQSKLDPFWVRTLLVPTTTPAAVQVESLNGTRVADWLYPRYVV